MKATHISRQIHSQAKGGKYCSLKGAFQSPYKITKRAVFSFCPEGDATATEKRVIQGYIDKRVIDLIYSTG